MPICKFCTKPFGWGQKEDGKWVPLVPIEEHEGMDRTFQDENGVLRASHDDICLRLGGPAVRVAKLAKKVKASDIIGEPILEKILEKINPETGEVTYDIG